ncbi:MAG: tyrosine-type recombinase/integrase [Betaproteobacteria bacterium]|nr:tyrosine-type recombinase/integrase [Betaproteobacteria bacterium]
MDRKSSTELAQLIQRFFEEYLPNLRGMSSHTIGSYRDAVVLFLRFLARHVRRRIETLQITDLTAARVEDFLMSLERERGNGITTRNTRLAALHTFARFLAVQRPQQLAQWQVILNVPFKRGARDAPIEHFDSSELDAFFRSIDRQSACGVRDYALFALMFNSGARVQEILNLHTQDLRLESPYQVRLHGKGNKVRLCPLWPATVKCLRAHLEQQTRIHADSDDTRLFRNRNGEPLTRFGVRYLLRKYVAAGAAKAATLRSKRLHPHSMRHTTALSLLKSGVDFATISQWLGHSALNVTMRYARSDIDLKRTALSQVFPDAIAPPKAGRLRIDGAELISWLRRL